MKKLATIALALFLIILTSSILKSCNVQNKLYSEKQLESENFSSSEWCILKDGTVVTELESVEWELYRGKLYREISVTVIDPNMLITANLIKMMSYMYYEYPDSKIEINNNKFINKNVSE
jgi:hypothetical protein